jgi:hypothetical protein
MKTISNRVAPARRSLRRAIASTGCALTLVCLAQTPSALGVTAAVGGGQTGQPGTGGDLPGASAVLEQCVTTGEQVERSVTFSGEMTAIAGTGHMAMRIDIQERMSPEGAFHTISAPGLGVWRGSDAGVKIYKYVKQVTDLSSPAVYRAVVRFHWLNARGHLVRHIQRVTPTCEQPALASASPPVTSGTTSTPTTPSSSAG